MSPEWLTRLSEKVLEANKEGIMDLIKKNPPSEVTLIRELNILVNKFQFETILDLIEPLLTKINQV